MIIGGTATAGATTEIHGQDLDRPVALCGTLCDGNARGLRGVVARPTAEGISHRPAMSWLVVLLAIVLGAFIVPAVATPLDLTGSNLIGRWLLEVWLIIGLAAWSLHRVDIRGLLTATQRTVTVVLIAGFLVSQLTFGRLGGYPFMPWGMYTVPQDRVVYADLVMLDGEDEVGLLPISSFVPADALGFLSRIEGMLRQAEEGDEEAARSLDLTVRRLLAAHGDPSVDAVDLRWCEVTSALPVLRTACTTALVVHR
jgi:hypothetical protein